MNNLGNQVTKNDKTSEIDYVHFWYKGRCDLNRIQQD